GKTQVFVTGQGDHYRTRLTHTMEVSQISRDISRTFSLNEDLTECISLAHDLGHPPFGHAGEELINKWMKQFNNSFEHNEQSYRIVTLLEDHCNSFVGLNLNQEILDGLLKHQTIHDQTSSVFCGQTLEAQVVNIADEIAYSAHDCDDGLSMSLFSLKDILDVPLAVAAHIKAKERGTSLRGALIHLLVSDLYSATETRIKEEGIASSEDVFSATSPLIVFSPKMIKSLSMLRTFLWDNMYNHPDVLSKSEAGKHKLKKLLSKLYSSPNEKVLELKAKTNGALEEAVKDYVAGMTERYAEEVKH
ncbi:MAG: HD domain-containing protein, partial [Candidatus Peribacteraceae bacterium]|nr:HD domain-containing protein [Candidatus Peribacteraceae bacterium]